MLSFVVNVMVNIYAHYFNSIVQIYEFYEMKLPWNF